MRALLAIDHRQQRSVVADHHSVWIKLMPRLKMA